MGAGLVLSKETLKRLRVRSNLRTGSMEPTDSCDPKPPPVKTK